MMRTRWRVLICFVVLPLLAFLPLFVFDALDWDLNDKQAIVGAVAITAAASWVVGYVHQRNFWEGVLYGMVTAALAVPAMYAVLITLLIVSCETGHGCLD
jgi:cytochrome c biogenesis protein CcdA